MNSTFSNHYYTYITSNPSRTVFYTGVTNNLKRRILEHFNNRGKPETFAGKYFCCELVYYESYFYINEAINREKEIKNLSRDAKIALIKSQNPYFMRLRYQ